MSACTVYRRTGIRRVTTCSSQSATTSRGIDRRAWSGRHGDRGPDLFRITTRQQLRHQTVVIRGLIPRMGVLKRLPVLGKDLLKDTPGPCGCCQHPSPPSEGVGIVTVPWLYHVSSALSTPPQALWSLLHSHG